MAGDRNQRFAVWVVLILGAVESVSLLLKAGPDNPSQLLTVLFSGWVLAPFAVLAWAHVASRRWTPTMHAAVQVMTVLVSVVSLALYTRWIPMPAGSPNAFVFVATPPATLIVLVFAFGTAQVVRNARTGEP